MLSVIVSLTALAMAGAVVGSFLALVSQRYSPPLSTAQWLQSLCHPASRCNGCRQKLAWHDLIPVISWLALGGRCRYCRCAITAQPLIFELTCALIFISSGMLFSSRIMQLCVALCGCLLLLLADIDRRYQRLPDCLTSLLLWSGLARTLFQSELNASTAVLGAFAGYLAFWLLALLYRLLRKREGLGRGDMKLFAALGAWTGWQALPLIATIAASLAFGMLMIFYLAGKAWTKETPLPFGPFLAAAGWYVVIAQSPLSQNLLL